MFCHGAGTFQILHLYKSANFLFHSIALKLNSDIDGLYIASNRQRQRIVTLAPKPIKVGDPWCMLFAAFHFTEKMYVSRETSFY